MSERKPFLPASLNYDDYFQLLAVKKPTEIKNVINRKHRVKRRQSKKERGVVVLKRELQKRRKKEKE